MQSCTLSAIEMLAGPNDRSPFRRVARLFELESDQFADDGMARYRSAKRFAAIVYTGPLAREFDERSQVGSGIRQNLFSRFLWIGCGDNRKQARNFGNSQLSSGPGSNDLRNRF